jgi:hypothetical protein
MRTRSIIQATIVVAAITLAGLPAWAQDIRDPEPPFRPPVRGLGATDRVPLNLAGDEHATFEVRLRGVMLYSLGTTLMSRNAKDVGTPDAVHARTDLGLVDPAFGFDLDGRFSLGELAWIEARWLRAGFAMETTVSHGFVYDDSPDISTGDRLRSDLRQNLVTISVGYELYRSPDLTVWAGLGLEAFHFALVFTREDSAGRATKEDERILSLMPLIRVGFEAPLATDVTVRASVDVGFLPPSDWVVDPTLKYSVLASYSIGWRVTSSVEIDVGVYFFAVKTGWSGRDSAGLFADNRIRESAAGPTIGISIRF